MAAIHDKKSADYAKVDNYYSNFEAAAADAGISVDEVFATLIGIKLARLRELKSKPPYNESVQDTRMDLAVYATLWMSYHEPTSIDGVCSLCYYGEGHDPGCILATEVD